MTAPKGFYWTDLTDAFFTEVAKGMEMELISWKPLDMEVGVAINSALSENIDTGTKLKGFFKFEVCGRDVAGTETTVNVILKSRSTSEEATAGWIGLMQAFGEESWKIGQQYFLDGLGGSRMSELEVLTARHAMKNKQLARIRPKPFHTVLDADREIFVVVMDYISQGEVEIGGQMISPNWTNKTRYAVLRELAKFNADFMGRTAEIEGDFDGALESNPRRHLKALPLWRELTRIQYAKHEKDCSEIFRKYVGNYLDNMASITEELEAYPMTLSHNDTHTGNLWVRKNPSDGQSHLILYDWEMVGIHVPQRDLALFLCCTLIASSVSRSELARMWSEHAEYYRKELVSALYKLNRKQAKIFEDKESFDRILSYEMFETFCCRSCLVPILPPELWDFSSNDRANAYMFLMETFAKGLITL